MTTLLLSLAVVLSFVLGVAGCWLWQSSSRYKARKARQNEVVNQRNVGTASLLAEIEALREGQRVQTDMFVRVQCELRELREATMELTTEFRRPPQAPFSSDVSRHYSAEQHSASLVVVDKPAITDVCSVFLRESDAQDFSADAAARWFSERRCSVEVLSRSDSDWTLLVVSADRSYVVPAVRRGMGFTPLSEYFELRNYNGVDPLKPAHVREFAELQRQDRSWAVLRKGLIDVT